MIKSHNSKLPYFIHEQDTEATKPTPDGFAPRCDVKSGRTGLFYIVELNMAKSPLLQSNMNGLNFTFS